MLNTEQTLAKALKEFKNKYLNVTSADLQTFILGWQACESSNLIIKKIKNKEDFKKKLFIEYF